MSLAGSHDPVDFLRVASGGAQRLLRGARTEGELVFILGGVGERLDARAAAEFAHRHAKGTVDVFRGKWARAGYECRASQKRVGWLPKVLLLVNLLLRAGHWDSFGHVLSSQAESKASATSSGRMP